MRRGINQKGQSILAEYTMIFFVVIAAIVAMTTFIQRGLQARIHDARNYVISEVGKDSVCDANCLQATGNQITYEYEPYYAQMISDVQQNQQERTGLTPGNPKVLGEIYTKLINEQTSTNSYSTQLPPEFVQ